MYAVNYNRVEMDFHGWKSISTRSTTRVIALIQTSVICHPSVKSAAAPGGRGSEGDRPCCSFRRYEVAYGMAPDGSYEVTRND